jgi:ketosteroid isomerase-like protein
LPRLRAPALWPVALALCAAPPAVGAQPATVETFRAVLDSLYAAAARGDSAALRPWLADDLRWTGAGGDATRAQLLAVLGRPQAVVPRYQVDSLRVQRLGDLALVDYHRVDRRTLGGYESTARWRALDVFAARGPRWQLVRHTQTWLVAPVVPVALDSAAMQPFVGRYAVAPGYVDDVHWERGRLVATVTGFPPGAPLVPVSATVFSPEGTGALIAFERDASGRVVGYVQGYPDGRVLRRPRLP